MTEKPRLPDEEQELYEHHRFVVAQGQGLIRIDKYLFSRIENVSRNKIQNAARAGSILVNDKPVMPNHRLHPLDVVTVVLPHPPRDIQIIPEEISIDIVYEDEDVVLVNKKPGMVVHPAYGNYTGTLVNALAFHFNRCDLQAEEPRMPYLVHRIDKDTSGLLVVTKNELAQTRLAREFYYHRVGRRYIGIVWGDFREDSGTIEGHVGRSLRDRKLTVVFPDGSHGKHAITHYRVLQRFGYITVCEFTLETGRTHQIRAHMKYIGHPLFSDEEYGGRAILKGTTFARFRQFVNNCFEICPRQALHAKSLEFKHPATGNILQFDSSLPEDMQRVIDKWESYTSGRRQEA
jgi:23S rRNA pseudouridine1911/1915/1917 synthase